MIGLAEMIKKQITFAPWYAPSRTHAEFGCGSCTFYFRQVDSCDLKMRADHSPTYPINTASRFVTLVIMPSTPREPFDLKVT